MRFSGKIGIRIFYPRSLGSWCIKGTDKSTLGKDSSVPLMHHDPSDLGSKIRIRIFPKKRTLSQIFAQFAQKYSQISVTVPLKQNTGFGT